MQIPVGFGIQIPELLVQILSCSFLSFFAYRFLSFLRNADFWATYAAQVCLWASYAAQVCCSCAAQVYFSCVPRPL